ncbi:MAG TPA: WD40 repeat domain-containing protein, partial [Candidatus Competibacter sp.]|nr:WD40 repeat domain-containing protein [Candidatus Competibacter sp.]
MRMNRQAEPVRIRWRFEIADSVQDLAWSPDGRWLAVAAVSGPLAVVDGATGDLRQDGPGHAGGTLKVAWSRD